MQKFLTLFDCLQSKSPAVKLFEEYFFKFAILLMVMHSGNGTSPPAATTKWLTATKFLEAVWLILTELIKIFQSNLSGVPPALEHIKFSKCFVKTRLEEFAYRLLRKVRTLMKVCFYLATFYSSFFVMFLFGYQKVLSLLSGKALSANEQIKYFIRTNAAEKSWNWKNSQPQRKI